MERFSGCVKTLVVSPFEAHSYVKLTRLIVSDGTSLESCGAGFKDQPTLMDHINRVHNTRHVESAVRINIVPSLMRAISVQKVSSEADPMSCYLYL